MQLCMDVVHMFMHLLKEYGEISIVLGMLGFLVFQERRDRIKAESLLKETYIMAESKIRENENLIDIQKDLSTGMNTLINEIQHLREWTRDKR